MTAIRIHGANKRSDSPYHHISHTSQCRYTAGMFCRCLWSTKALRHIDDWRDRSFDSGPLHGVVRILDDMFPSTFAYGRPVIVVLLERIECDDGMQLWFQTPSDYVHVSDLVGSVLIPLTSALNLSVLACRLAAVVDSSKISFFFLSCVMECSKSSSWAIKMSLSWSSNVLHSAKLIFTKVYRTIVTKIPRKYKWPTKWPSVTCFLVISVSTCVSPDCAVPKTCNLRIRVNVYHLLFSVSLVLKLLSFSTIVVACSRLL